MWKGADSGVVNALKKNETTMEGLSFVNCEWAIFLSCSFPGVLCSRKTNVMSVFDSGKGNANFSEFHLGVKCFVVCEVNDDAMKSSSLSFVNGHGKSKFKLEK